MKLYNETPNTIYETQNLDPFFFYLTKKIYSYIPTNKKCKIVDLGCGSGRNVFYGASLGHDVVGYDYMIKAIQNGNNLLKKSNYTGSCKFIKSDITKLTPKDIGKVDFVILNEVIEHLINYEKVIKLAFDILKPGGRIIITTPNDPKQWNKLDEFAEHKRRFKISELKSSLVKFSDCEFYTLGFPLHRFVITMYSHIISLINKDHQPKVFRANYFIRKLYYLIGTIVMNIDDTFQTNLGTTIFATGIKK